jgi:hypothetical protein
MIDSRDDPFSKIEGKGFHRSPPLHTPSSKSRANRA